MLGEVIVTYEGFSTFVTLIPLVVVVDSEVKPAQGTVCSSSFTILATQL